ncbi:hypothetical protein J6590_037666 [Homalodisca vitripennis]|nr:hypothetical protein J6590_037666 [Homalodisca vitripennis]
MDRISSAFTKDGKDKDLFTLARPIKQRSHGASGVVGQRFPHTIRRLRFLKEPRVGEVISDKAAQEGKEVRSWHKSILTRLEIAQIQILRETKRLSVMPILHYTDATPLTPTLTLWVLHADPFKD